MSLLLDTNVLSELRKGERANALLLDWFNDVADEEIHLSVLVIGEIRRGVETIRKRDGAQAAAPGAEVDSAQERRRRPISVSPAFSAASAATRPVTHVVSRKTTVSFWPRPAAARDRKSTRLNSSHRALSRMPSSA